MFNEICIYFLLFIVYSMIGWCLETIYTRLTDKVWSNRGFLIGPYCPIYGIGAVSVVLFLSKYVHHPVALFILAIAICSVLEYFTSYFLEKLFGARWWDYTDKKINLNGRICLINSLLFGVISSAIVYFINPLINYLLNLIPIDILNSIAIVTFFIFMFDSIISCFIMVKIKNFIRDLVFP